MLKINYSYDDLLDFFDQFVDEGFVKAPTRTLALNVDSPESVLDAMANFVPLQLTPILQTEDI